MPPKRKRDSLEIFQAPTDEKTKKRLKTILEHEDIAPYNLKSLELGHIEGKPTGLALCECGQTFVAGSNGALHLDKIRIHLSRNHASRSSPWDKKLKQIPEDLVNGVHRQNAVCIATHNLPMNIFSEQAFVECDRILLKGLSHDPEGAQDLKMSRYLLRKRIRDNAILMKEQLGGNFVLLANEGFISLLYDHKTVGNKTSDYQDNILSLVCLIHLGNRSKPYTLFFEPVDSLTKLDTVQTIRDALMKDYGINLDEITTPLPITVDGGEYHSAKMLSVAFNVCLAHSMNVASKGAVIYAQRYFDLENEEKRIDNFLLKARKGLSKEELKIMKKEGMPQSLADFFYDLPVTEKDSVKIFKMRNPESKLEGDALKSMAGKKITQYPMPANLNKIRFNRMDQHLDLLLCWEDNMLMMDSASSKYRYLITSLADDYPNMAYVRAHKLVTTIFRKHILRAEKNSTRVPDVSQIFEDCFRDILSLNLTAHNYDLETADNINSLCKDPFYLAQELVICSVTTDWPNEARDFVVQLSQKLETEPEELIMDELVIEEQNSDIDPDVLRQSRGSQPRINSPSVEGEIERFKISGENMWRAAIKAVEKMGAQVTASSCLRSFYKLYRKDFPRLAKIADYLCAMNGSASEIERSFASTTAQVQDPKKNRTKAAKIEETLQFKQSKEFLDMMNEALKMVKKGL
ncbi:Oidioi.mRNA.OKI2018_I69.chr1.g3172.t1.cds [Oikopleura dioica]|uniref:Oidioi.mRNA.OKI2018_I69.chr1.g3172.t1.cds n=1 Tax=Oikopleura dioica TaxID=34765 RepID=A0ABN7SXK5_OIKDI|nr:Oidioi.mRNA.OKI2018_I69.chr1.g3172.t1.cds [Oikopleura dioica]